MPYSTSFDGTIHILPFDGGSLASRIQHIYTSTIEDLNHDVRDILVLKRLPNKVPEFTSELREVVGLQTRPNVKSIARHASTVLKEAQPQIVQLSYEQRIEFLAAVLDGHNWSSYFEQASEHDSFGSDVGQLLLDATWQGGFDTESIGKTQYDDYLRELAEVNETFHNKLMDRNLVEQADTVPLAMKDLRRSDIREQVEREFDVIIAVEFEEYSAVERAYLSSLSENAELICIAERDASIERIKKEPGSVDRFTGGLDVIDHTKRDEETYETIPAVEESMAGQPFAEFLATGAVDNDSVEIPARLIEAETIDRQVQEVANEIEYLRQKHNWEYDDFAVLIRSVGDPMPHVRRILQHSGIPTASVGVSGLEQDLAVRELHALAQYYTDENKRALELLQARVPSLDIELIEDCVDTTSIAISLKQWIVSTNLKDRIAKDAKDIDAREQFQNISKLLSIAEFVDEQDFLSKSWFDFISMLERAITYDAPYAHTAEVNVAEGGVTVGDVSLMKNDSRKAIFLINVIDSEYPGEEDLSKLFPTTWIKKMNGYPAVTNPTSEDIIETFTTASASLGDEFEQYHNHRARRQLAIGARAAEEKLYFCTYRTTRVGLGKPEHQSRYLYQILQHPELKIETVAGAGKDRDIFTIGSASAEILAQPWQELERIQAIASKGGNVELKTTEETFAAIQKVIEDSDTVNPRFVEAVDIQFDLARGAIRPAVMRTAEVNDND